MSSPIQTEAKNNSPTSLEQIRTEDIHGEASNEILGRESVLKRDAYIGYIVLRDTYKANGQNDQTDHGSIFRDDILDLTPEQRDQVYEFRDLESENVFAPDIDDIRSQIQSDINPNIYGQSFDDLFNEIAPPIIKHWVEEWSEKHLPEDRRDAVWWQWMTARSDDKEEQTLLDEQFYNFLQWHNHRIEGLQADPAYESIAAQETVKYMAKTELLEQDGWVVPGTSERIRTSVKEGKLKHFVGDEFATARLEAAAYATYSDGTIHYKPSDRQTRDHESHLSALLENVASTAPHEINHLELGRFQDRWLNEAITEITARAHNTGSEGISVAAFNQDTTSAYGNAYNAEIDLLFAIIDVAHDQGVDMSIRDFTLAYSEAYSEYDDHTYELNSKLHEIFGFDLMDGIRTKLEEYEEEFMQNNPGTSLEESQIYAINIVRSAIYQRPGFLQPTAMAA